MKAQKQQPIRSFEEFSVAAGGRPLGPKKAAELLKRVDHTERGASLLVDLSGLYRSSFTERGYQALVAEATARAQDTSTAQKAKAAKIASRALEDMPIDVKSAGGVRDGDVIRLGLHDRLERVLTIEPHLARGGAEWTARVISGPGRPASGLPLKSVYDHMHFGNATQQRLVVDRTDLAWTQGPYQIELRLAAPHLTEANKRINFTIEVG